MKQRKHERVPIPVDTDVMPLKELANRADKVIKLIKKFNEVFPEKNEQEHLKLSIMAGLSDAYRAGQNIKFRIVGGSHDRVFNWFNENYSTADINKLIDDNFWDLK